MRRVLDVLGPWAWLFGCGAAGVLIMLAVLRMRDRGALGRRPCRALPTREPTGH